MHQTIFEEFSQKNVLIVGDVMVDRYLTGSVNRISPEAPVPVVQLISAENRLGGAANVALNVKALGGTPLLFSVVGKDEMGSAFIQLLKDNQIWCKGIFQSKFRQSTVKTRIVSAGQQLLRVDKEDTADLNSAETEQLLKLIRQRLDTQPVDVVLFQDYNKGVLTANLIREVILEAVKRSIPTVVDPKKKNFWEYKRVTLFKPNLKEVRDSMPFGVEPTLASLATAAKHIRSQLSNEYNLITLSEKGIFYDMRHKREIFPTQPRSIADVSGAGDTVISVAALALACGTPLADIALLANLAGGQVCEKSGVVPVDLSQLQKEYEQLKSPQLKNPEHENH